MVPVCKNVRKGSKNGASHFLMAVFRLSRNSIIEKIDCAESHVGRGFPAACSFIHTYMSFGAAIGTLFAVH